MVKRILIVDDDRDILNLMKLKLKNYGYTIFTESSPVEALNRIKDEHFDLILVDQLMPELSGLEFIDRLKERDIKTPVILMTAYGSLEDAVLAMKKGAFHYITKPINFEELKIIIDQALEVSDLKKELNELKSLLSTDIIAESPQMKQVLETAKKIAPFDTTVLITGESGTGKEMIANFIHKNSLRKERPFIAINCGAIPSELLESELFGYKKGAFTGANTDKKGLIEEAEGGTLFLDEIGELPLDLQVKLLRVLQENEIKPIGSNRPKKIDVRFIAATNRDLKKMVEEGKFREDLYYRINVIPIHIPPLRERKEDIIPLAQYFINKFCSRYGIPKKRLSEKAREKLLNYDYKGNVRELENIIERAVLTTEGEEITDIPVTVSKRYILSQELKPFKEAKKEFEESYLKNLLEKTDFNISKASKIAGITRAQIYRMIKRYGIEG
ncbi:MAG TPA: sigma-54-dependent Fis family transcriptional regulator [Persephonella sp.]|uniref:Transcriptional regulatory protein ZraR n=1 Tax=Persephonella marina (strain DSM 14350 / EX-H1) TaxID=123214 RepID=C0QRG3_PERMH|nr:MULTISPECIES: sigma-54 dependent transcriptional regulator [Persephonella]ACO04020.1 transcriptional regulatory protein ZraR [Persephonella marina EX-H1]HCB69005.1 sigma-54-dependent Fis family transcriptional regulator [Persephonella sp.]